MLSETEIMSGMRDLDCMAYYLDGYLDFGRSVKISMYLIQIGW